MVVPDEFAVGELIGQGRDPTYAGFRCMFDADFFVQ